MNSSLMESILKRNKYTGPHFRGCFYANDLFDQAVHHVSAEPAPSVFLIFVEGEKGYGHWTTLCLLEPYLFEEASLGTAYFLDPLGLAESDYVDTQIPAFVRNFCIECKNLSDFPPLQNKRDFSSLLCGVFSLFLAHQCATKVPFERLLAPFNRIAPNDFELKARVGLDFVRNKFPYSEAKLTTIEALSSEEFLDPALRYQFTSLS